MRIVLDTNVLIAAFISHGQSAELLEYLIRRHTIVLSQFILDEFRDKLTSKFKFSAASVNSAIELIIGRSEIVESPSLDSSVSRDPDDDYILSTARSGNAHCIVTGDKDLLVLESFCDIPILRPAQFWAFEAR